jgi:hypothetical protein
VHRPTFSSAPPCELEFTIHAICKNCHPEDRAFRGPKDLNLSPTEVHRPTFSSASPCELEFTIHAICKNCHPEDRAFRGPKDLNLSPT